MLINKIKDLYLEDIKDITINGIPSDIGIGIYISGEIYNTKICNRMYIVQYIYKYIEFIVH